MDKRLIAVLIIAAIALVFAFTSQQKPLAYSDKDELEPQMPAPMTTGIRGSVTLISGDCMPGEPSKTHPCTRTNISRAVYIREPATSANRSTAKLVKQITSGANGYYEVELPAGTYSIFVEDEGREYCNFFGGLGEACQITITDKVAEFDINIDKAAR